MYKNYKTVQHGVKAIELVSTAKSEFCLHLFDYMFINRKNMTHWNLINLKLSPSSQQIRN